MWYYVAYVYNGELISLIGNQRVGIFPPKSEIVFVLSLALIWCRNFQDRTIPVGGDTWSSCTSERRNNKNNKRDTCWLAFAEVVRKNHGNNIAGRSSDSSLAFKQIFNDYGEIWKESRWKVTQLLSEVRRPSADCQSTFSRRFKQLGILLKRSLNGHATVVGGHATVGRLSNNVFWTFQAFRKKFEKKSLNGHATVVGGHATVGRLSNNVFGRFKRFGKILKKVAERSRDSGWSHATVGRLSNNVFWTFQAIRKKFEKSRWTVTRQWSEVTRPSADCQTTFFGRFKQLEKNWKKFAERSRDSGRRSRDRRPTVKQRFWTFQAIWEILIKVAERSRDSGWGHATVGRLSNNVFWTFQTIWENFEKSRWTVTQQWMRSRDRRPTVKQRFLDVSSN